MAQNNPSKVSPLGKAVEWFFRRSALRQIRADLAQSPSYSSARRAATAWALGERLAELPNPPASSAVDSMAFEAYRRGIYYALDAIHGSASDAPPDGGSLPGSSERRRLLEERWPALEASLSSPKVLKDALFESDFQIIEGLPDDTLGKLRLDARACLTALLVEAEGPALRLRRTLRQRTLRLGALAVVVSGLSIGGLVVAQKLDQRTDLLQDAPFRASSKFPGCNLEEGVCGHQKVDIFFCTKEERHPWVEFDLGEPKSFSSISIKNRSDCCAERAVPLAVEASDDAEEWHELARHNNVFSKLELDFEPVTHRYVRLRALRRTFLHFEDVQLFE